MVVIKNIDSLIDLISNTSSSNQCTSSDIEQYIQTNYAIANTRTTSNKSTAVDKDIIVLKKLSSAWSNETTTTSDKTVLGNCINLLIIYINTTIIAAKDNILHTKYPSILLYNLANSIKLTAQFDNTFQLLSTSIKYILFLLNETHLLSAENEEPALSVSISKCLIHTIQNSALLFNTLTSPLNDNKNNNYATTIPAHIAALLNPKLLQLACSHTTAIQFEQLMIYALQSYFTTIYNFGLESPISYLPVSIWDSEELFSANAKLRVIEMVSKSPLCTFLYTTISST
jgi:hypothetical protein